MAIKKVLLIVPEYRLVMAGQQVTVRPHEYLLRQEDPRWPASRAKDRGIGRMAAHALARSRTIISHRAKQNLVGLASLEPST